MDDNGQFQRVGITNCPLCDQPNLSWYLKCSWCGCPVDKEQDEKDHTMENAA
jgi:hypothetical protein